MKGRVLAGHRAGTAEGLERYHILPSFIGEIGIVTAGTAGSGSAAQGIGTGRQAAPGPAVPAGGAKGPAAISGPLAVRRVFLPRPGVSTEEMIRLAFPSARRAEAPQGAARLLAAYLDGGEADFSRIAPDLEGLPDFVKRTLAMCRQIPRGSVISYGGLATAVGSPRAARAVGSAMAANPVALIIPCHRVVQSGGRLGGFGGGGQAMKRRLLEWEGVAFDRCGRVLPAHLVGP
jgi:methylated-DNA-[protein]-cysteine S-methyltransferase